MGDTGLQIKGKWKVVVTGPDGKQKDYREGFNVVTTVGKEFIASFLGSAAAAASTFTAKYIAVGTDGTGEAAGDVALGTEVNRTTGTVSYVSNQVYQITASFATGSATGQISEYGLFSSSAAGTLITRDTEATLAIGASDTLTVTHQITIG